ncbi:MAG: amidohydrolase [Anaerolineaceae bacterium]|nr:amidohydrolase [Anaerolineaceae bacterium]
MILIDGCSILPMTEDGKYYKDGAILVDGKHIVYVGPRKDIPTLSLKEPLETIHAAGMLALPGLIDAHIHMTLNITKGFVEDVDFKDILFEVLYPAEANLSSEEVYYACLVGGLEAIKQGATTLIDQYHHGQITESVVNKLGVRAELSLMAQDFDLAHPPKRNPKTGWIETLNPDFGLRELDENLQLAKNSIARKDALIKWRIGINTPDTVSDITLKEASRIAHSEGLGAHIHLAQSAMEQRFSMEHRSCTSVEYLDQIGLLDINLIAAHCTVLEERDVDLLAKSQAVIGHCPISNAKGGPVIAPIPLLINRGAKVALGTDSTPADMLEVIRYTSVIHKLPSKLTTTMPALQALRLATIDAARAIGRDSEIGSLEPGKLADLILIDTAQPHLQPMENISSTIVYNAHGTDVSFVMVDGRFIVKNHRHTLIDEENILSYYRKLAHDFWKRVNFHQ